jgi:2-polyprenyl-6-methoxyphenol hydroxylase-like FAD-dependent oxidoreductase
MADVVVLGGGICGLAAAMMLARDGHDVTVLERDTPEPPASIPDAFEGWDRPGVNQFKLGHYMHPRFRHVLDDNLPDVRDRLFAGGALRYDLVTATRPSAVPDDPHPGDDRYWTVTARRPVLEAAFAQAAAEEDGLRVERGVTAAGLLTGAESAPGVPHVVGVTTEDGREIRADVVVDAMGRRSAIGEWIAAAGGRRPQEEAEPNGFAYYGRYFKSKDGRLPEVRSPLLTAVGTMSALTLPSDNDTWVVIAVAVTGDAPMKQLRFEDKWRRVMGSLPTVAHWLDGEPIDDFLSMAGILDRYRAFVVDGVPVATGLLAVADAWACTNPSLGRGVSLGVWHAAMLRDLLRTSNGDPASTALAWHAATEETLRPWYDAQIAMDRARIAEIDALREGREPPGPADDDIQAQMTKAFITASQHDADCFRAFLEVQGCLATPEEILSRPGMFEKVIAAADGRELGEAPHPSRAELLELLS